MDEERIKKAYQEISEVCEKYSDVKAKYGFRDIDDMYAKAKGHLILIEWQEKYGIALNHNSGNPYLENYLPGNNHLDFYYFEDAEKCKIKGYGRSISWPDDDRQPDDGWYLKIEFPVGPFIFGEDYDDQKQLFEDFFREMRTYKPDYSDKINRELYWKIENSKEIFNNFQKILDKYNNKNRAEINTRKVERLRRELKEAEQAIK